VTAAVDPAPTGAAADLGAGRTPVWVAVGGVVALLVAVGASVALGPADISAGGALLALVDALPLVEIDTGLTERQLVIVSDLRIPRAVLGALVGAMLSVAGAAYQGVFRNPLADPYLLGVAAGAGVGATLASAVGSLSGVTGAVPAVAFLGAVVGVVATYTLGRTVGDRSVTTLILAGVAVAAFLTAIQVYVQQRHSDTLREVYSWILGRLGTNGWDDVTLLLPYVVLSSAVILAHRRLLDVLAVGEDEATVLGVPTARVRLWLVAAATLGTAAAVSVSGLIGFVGIIVPHAVRLMAGTSYRVIIPLSRLFGAAFMVATDLVARTIVAPAELPIGVVTAFLGAPFFLVVLRTSRRPM
jgi:iron complex transport system permease protein